MSLIGKKILRWKTKWTTKNVQRSIVAIPYDLSKSFGLLYSYENSAKEEALRLWVDQLISEQKEVHVLCIQSNSQPVMSNFPTMTMAQMNTMGQIKAEVIDEFLERSYDYLIHLDFEANEVIDMIIKKTKAKCKIGFYSEQHQKNYDMMIGMNKSAGMVNFVDQVTKYLKSIN